MRPFFSFVVVLAFPTSSWAREVVRGVAKATPIFWDLFYIPDIKHIVIKISGFLTNCPSGHLDFWPTVFLAIWPSCHLDIWPSVHTAIRTSSHLDFWHSGFLAIQTSSHPDFWPSGLLDIWTSGYPGIWPSGHLPIKLSGHLAIWPPIPKMFWLRHLCPKL